ncbi:MAG: hypothetical protein VW524_07715, partial [Halieaceae bacterium]
ATSDAGREQYSFQSMDGHGLGTSSFWSPTANPRFSGLHKPATNCNLESVNRFRWNYLIATLLRAVDST